MTFRRIAAGALLAAIAVAVALAASEAAVRLIDGYPLSTLRLRHAPPAPAPTDLERAKAGTLTVPVAAGVDRAWFEVRLEQRPAPPPDPILAPRLPAYWTLGLPSLYEWNVRALEAYACRDPKAFADNYARYKDVFVFEPVEDTIFPTFRFLRKAAYTSGLKTNEFGWRGPSLSLSKPDRTIRIAFVGASTTVGAHGTPASYPEYIGVWLNLWAKTRGLDVGFDVINAGREGINSDSIAAIVRQEVLPLEPDLVLYYEGSNQFWPADFIEWPDGKAPIRPREDPRLNAPWPAERVSALAVRTHSLYEALTTRGEPSKPQFRVRWPSELNELDPALNSPVMPLSLNVVLKDLEQIRSDVAASGGDLVVETFFWLVWDGMKLDPLRNSGPFGYLNKTFWPFSYAHMRRLADFQNRVLTKFTRIHHLDLIDFASAYPRDPGLFEDAIHFMPEGIRLQGWVVLQQLIPLIERRMASGALPRPARTHLTEHPAFAQNPRRLVPVTSIGQHCTT